MITVTSIYAATPIVPADAHGPYSIPAGTPVTLDAGPADPSATYAWDLGDGSSATTPSVTHAYGEAKTYVAKLTVVVTQAGGARTRDFAEIVVTNTTPEVQLNGPDTVNEGDVITFAGSFTDAEWLDKHSARWQWDDPSGPDVTPVTETNDPPASVGTTEGRHAWGDSGSYLVTLLILDEDGAVGQATKQVTVLNMPPVVRAPRAVFAYPCTVTTLQADFVDPGWLDLHTAVWHFGDTRCTAIVREQNTPPQGRGTATASHIYHELGTYHAQCVVTDDDGATGQDATIVRVVDVCNREFEGGFRLRLLGEVANCWEPYSLPLPSLGLGQAPAPVAQTPVRFSAEGHLIRQGEYAQRIRPMAGQRAGLWQRVGANAGWEYQITAWYSLAQRADEADVTDPDPEDANTWARPDCARLGIDPLGGADPSSPTIVWSRGTNRLEWCQLVASACAEGHAITIFLEAAGGDLLSADVCFDHVALIPTCRVLSPKSNPPPVKQCCSFENNPLGRVHAPLHQAGFAFSAQDVSFLEIVSVGSAVGTHKLVVPAQSLMVALPFDATVVVATLVALREETTATLEALDATEATIATVKTPLPLGTSDVSVSGAAIHSVVVTCGKGAGLLVRICASTDKQTAA
jgi:hypothetical protein